MLLILEVDTDTGVAYCDFDLLIALLRVKLHHTARPIVLNGIREQVVDSGAQQLFNNIDGAHVIWEFKLELQLSGLGAARDRIERVL